MINRTSTRFIAPMIEGAEQSRMPGFIPQQLAALRSKAPVGDKWLHEIKYDGYRVQVHLNEGRVVTSKQRAAVVPPHADRGGAPKSTRSSPGR